MTLAQLKSDMIAAMKAGDKVKKNNISFLVGAIKKVAIDKGLREDIPDELVDEVILKETKLAKEQVDTCPDSREDLKAEYTIKYETFKSYAPAQLSEEEIEKFIIENFKDLVDSKNKGMLMKNAMPALKGKADGKVINQVVAKLCN